MFPLYGNQSIDLHGKIIDWFLHILQLTLHQRVAKNFSLMSSKHSLDMIIVKRDLKEALKQALSVAHGHLKRAIEHLLNFTKTQLQTMKDYINALLKKVFEVARGKREIGESFV